MNLFKKLYDKNVWSSRFRPTEIDDVIIPDKIKGYFRNTINEDNLTNCIFYGPKGSGKTTVAFILSEKLDRDTLYIEGSKETSIDILRGKLTEFVSSVSMNDKKKLIIIDEADGGGRNAMLQKSLKNFIESFSSSCSFIFITNFINLIDAELISRLESIEFSFNAEDQIEMRKQFGKILLAILDKEGYTYDKKVLGHIIKLSFPDFRKCLNEVQKYAKQDRLCDLSLISECSQDMSEYYRILKDKDFTAMISFVANINNSNDFFSKIYDTCRNQVEDKSIPDLVVLLGTYAYRSSFVIDPRINLSAFSTELMTNIKVKD